MGLFSAKTKLKDVRTREAKSADQYLNALLKQGTPKFPEEQVAGMSEAEQLAQELLRGYGQREGEGLSTLREMAGASDNILEDPTITALMEVIGKRGNQTANRLSRSLMLRGGRGSAGRDMLGRAVTETQNEMLSTLAPYATQRRQQKLTAAQMLNTLGEGSTLNRLNALSTTGSLPRTLEQMKNSANYQKLLQQVLFPYQQGLNVAGTIKKGGQMAVEQSDSLFSQLAPVLGMAAKAIPGIGPVLGAGMDAANAAGAWQKTAEAKAGRSYGNY